MQPSTKLIEAFRGKKVLIAGDLVADQFLHGTIARVSREAPVFILEHDVTHTVPGGAANAAVNVASLGGKPILIGVVGKDANGKLLTGALENAHVGCESVIAHDGLNTTTKVRVLAGQHYAARQQVIRIDYGRSKELSTELTERLCDLLTAAAANTDAIVISDYNYGVVSTRLFEAAREAASKHSVPLLIDSRFRLTDFQGAASATPNQDEVENVLGKNFSHTDCEGLCKRLGYRSLLVTRGNKGMVLFEAGCPPFEIEAVGATEPVDVTGAGDTVIAAYALGLAAGLSFRAAASVANHAGGIVVMKKGTAAVSAAELEASINGEELPAETGTAAS